MTSRAAWLQQFLTSVDSMDTDRLAAHFAPDASFRFGNNQPMHGHGEIKAGIGAFFGAIKGIRHVVTARYEPSDGVLAAELRTTYTRLDGNQVTLDSLVVFDLAADLITGYRVYTDLAPLFVAQPV